MIITIVMREAIAKKSYNPKNAWVVESGFWQPDSANKEDAIYMPEDPYDSDEESYDDQDFP